MTGNWLDKGEEMVLQPLEDSPLPLRELRWNEETPLRELADVLSPALISLEARGLIEVRRFRQWPAQWDDGVPLTGDDLAQECMRAEAWSDKPEAAVLAAHITKTGRRLL